MAKRKLSDEQILNVVKQLDAGRTAAEVAREVCASTYTIYAWKACEPAMRLFREVLPCCIKDC
jgi:transposase